MWLCILKHQCSAGKVLKWLLSEMFKQFCGKWFFLPHLSGTHLHCAPWKSPPSLFPRISDPNCLSST